jgi:hypothetical protein
MCVVEKKKEIHLDGWMIVRSDEERHILFSKREMN